MPKLSVSTPDDPLEREADRVAEAVTSSPGPVAPLSAGPAGALTRVQRACACGGGGQGSCCGASSSEANSDRDKEMSTEEPQEKLFRAAVGDGAPRAPPSVANVVASSGEPLAAAVRGDLEPRFGCDFSAVRVHTDARAAASASEARALAYTVGTDIAFAAGQYAPGTAAGRRVIAHELAHVVQQAGPGRAPPSAQRLGDVSRVPAGLACPVANSSAANVVANIGFDIESASLSPTALAAVVAFIGSWNAAGADDAVRVDGFASVDGDDPLNWRLSCQRAQAVVTELETPSSGGAGIPNTFIEFFMQGETSEFSASSLPENRRATIAADLSAPPPPVCANPGVARSLDVQPVFLRTDPSDAAPTGTTWTRRLNQANAIWGKVGVTFVELTPVTIDTPLKTNGTDNAEVNAVRALRSAAGVEVFLVDNDMATSGGASTTGTAVPNAWCGADGNMVMSDRGTSDTLLAHELGHIIGLDHPGTPPNPGDPGTIMQASNSNSTANPTRNTLVNFAAILCPAPNASTCLNPDP